MTAEERGPGSGDRGPAPARPTELRDREATGVRLWMRQALAITRLELRKCFRGRRLIGITLLNLAPVAILALIHFVPESIAVRKFTPTRLAEMYAVMFTIYLLRVGVFFTSAALSIQLFRTEVLEKTFHYYLLAPVRRQVVMAGKFVAACMASAVICGTAVIASYFVLFSILGDGLGKYMFSGPGSGHLVAYLGVTVLGCVGYGAVLALFGQLWKNPIIPALVLFGWESVLFLLPPFLKLTSVLFYLESLLPYRPPVGPLAILADPPPTMVSVVGMFAFAGVVLILAGWRASRMEIVYSTD